MLRFKSGDCETPPGGPSPPSPYSKSPLGGDGVLGASVPMHRRAPRRIARTPFKVIHVVIIVFFNYNWFCFAKHSPDIHNGFAETL